MKCVIALVLVGVVTAQAAVLAVDSKGANYIGGTVAAFVTMKDPIEGKIDSSKEVALTFTADDKPFRGTLLTIPYDKITELEYGQKAGRRVAVAIMVSPLALFSKKRNHFLTVTYKDDADKEQSAIFELGKDIVRTTIKIIETRAGKKVTYQDEEARKYGTGGD